MEITENNGANASNPPSNITVAAAVIEYGGKYLLLKRKGELDNGGLWEFPGGKMAAHESLQQCLIRELKEELNVTAEVGEILGSCVALAGTKRIQLFGLETVLEKEPTVFRDHSEMRWVKPKEFSQYPMTDAELALIRSMDKLFVQDLEIKSVSIFSVMKIFGAAYAALGIFLGVFIFATSMALPIPIEKGFRIGIAVCMPLFQGIFGVISGAIVAIVYNGLAMITGGIKVRYR